MLENTKLLIEELNKRVPYNIRPALTDMQNKNLIADNCAYFM